MLPILKSTGNFLQKHKGKLAIAAIVAIACTVYVNYSSGDNVQQNDEDEKNTTKVKSLSISDMNKEARIRILFRIKKQFDVAAQQFLPTLRTKIVEVVDINGTLKQIRELRSNSPSFSNKNIVEDDLWDEIKIASFTILYATTYMLCAVCTLLRIQLHILARSIYNSESQYYEKSNDFVFDSQVYRELMDKTYQYVFDIGLKNLILFIKHKIKTALKQWTIKTKLSVDYEEFQELLLQIRKSIEIDLKTLVATILIRF
jgi:hypothetical protein